MYLSYMHDKLWLMGIGIKSHSVKGEYPDPQWWTKMRMRPVN